MKQTKKVLCLVALLALGQGALYSSQAVASAAVPAQPVDLTYAAEMSVQAVVHIKFTQNRKTQTVDVIQSDPFGDFFGFGNGNRGSQKREVETPKKEGTGSGVIISKDGYIVTNNHVVDKADVLTVTLNDGREFDARIIGQDATTDLALIKIEGDNFPTIPIGNSDALKVGEWVLAVGNPFNLNSTVTAGIVSAKARSLGANGVESFIQTDAAINAGNSGGALVNTKGELVGINAMIYSQTGSYAGYGFAIPVTIMNKVVADLKKYGTVQRAVLGIKGGDLKNYIDSEKSKGNTPQDFGTFEGVYVSEVSEGSAAETIGLKKGDVIVAVNGKNVTKLAELQEIIARHRPGDKISVTYMRDKKRTTKEVTVKNEQGNTKVVKEADMEVLGAAFKELTPEQKKQYEVNYGLQVTAVRSGKMKDAGIQKGFIILKANNTAIRTVADLENVLKAAYKSPEQTLWIYGKTQVGKSKSFAVTLED